MTEKNLAIGVDLGGTKISFGLVDQFGSIQKKIRIATDVKGGPAAIQHQIISTVNDLRQMTNEPIIGMGIGVAGQIEKNKGVVLFAPNLNWKNEPLQECLQKETTIPIAVINDVRAATWGEWLFGAGKGSNNIVCVFVGTGIGGGVISSGNLLTGASNTFGEIGHMTIDINGPMCTCGKKGCFESIAGGWGIAKMAQEAVSKNQDKGKNLLKLANGQIDKIDAKIIVQAAKSGDSIASSLMQKVLEALIGGCSSLVNIYNPQRFILGGGFIDGNPDIIPMIEKGIKQNALAAAVENLEVLHAQLDGEAGVVGGAAFAFKTFFKTENQESLSI
ncbi:MAG: ROK family protein [Parachlamydiaceae bacterium]|nr:ROK family protein [Parachlamydiaceae bacterium]